MNKIKVYNSLSNKKEDFVPIDKDNVRIYACGPTVYNYAHIGNARMAVVFDTIVKLLRYSFPKVTYVSNITDIPDVRAVYSPGQGVIAARAPCDVFVPWVHWERGPDGI